MTPVMTTERLVLREFERKDRDALAAVLGDEKTMYAWESAFSDAETDAWLDRRIAEYRERGVGIWALFLRDGTFVGYCGIGEQQFCGKKVPEIAYALDRCFWHRGYATEAARKCVDYALGELGYDAVYCMVRDNNKASIAVAERLGMTRCGSVVKCWKGKEMPHIVFCAKRGRRRFL